MIVALKANIVAQVDDTTDLTAVETEIAALLFRFRPNGGYEQAPSVRLSLVKDGLPHGG